MPSICVGLNITVSCVEFVTVSVALFLMNFIFIERVICSFMSRSFVMAISVISSLKGAFKTISFCSLGFNSTFSFWKTV